MKKSILSILLLFATIVAYNQISINKVDPPFWWADMKNPNLQLLVNGNNISETNVMIKQKGFSLKKLTRLGNNYLILDLNIGNAKPGQFLIEFMKDGKLVTALNYELKVRKPNSGERGSFNTSDVIYLIMPDRFANGNPENDNMPGMLEKADRNNPHGRHGGDIEGITNNLDYLQKMGVTTIWHTPLLENNMPAYSYHGYAITDFYKIDPRFGTNQSYRNMVAEAHDKSLKVVMDMVFNHFGTGHAWMQDLPEKDWVNQWSEFTRSNYRGGVITDPYRSQYDETKMANGWFDVTMADLNQKNPYVAQYLIQNSIWWVEYADLDGIRQDTYPYPDKEFMARWMQELRFEYPNLNVVGEAWINYVPQISYWLENNHNTDGYNSALTNVFDFPLMMALQKALTEGEGWDTGLARLYELLSQDFLYSDPSKVVTFADNHDIERIYQVIKTPANIKMAMGFLATTRGIPLIYYGTEALSDRGSLEGDPGKRKDFPGGWKGDTINFFTQKNLSADQTEVYSFMVKLLNWRKNCTTVQQGKLTHYIPEDGIYVYFRTLGEKVVMVLMNNAETQKTINTTRFAENMIGFRTGFNIINQSQLTDLKQITIEGKSILILELKK